MTTLRKTPPKKAFLGVTLTVLALASGTFWSDGQVAADGPIENDAVQVESMPELPVPPATWNG